MADDSKTSIASAHFKKLQKAEDGKKAMSEYEAERAAVEAKTQRLRELRLARDAASPPPAPAKAPSGAKKSTTKSKKTAGTLGGWLASQKASGRRS